MKKTTSIQRLTIAMLLGYFFWEIGIWIWSRNLSPSDPIIRIDLIFIYPFLLILVFISIYQYFKKKSQNL